MHTILTHDNNKRTILPALQCVSKNYLIFSEAFEKMKHFEKSEEFGNISQNYFYLLKARIEKRK